MVAGEFYSHEESPGFTGQGCRVTPGGGDSKDSATETNCLHGAFFCEPRLLRPVQVTVERRGKSSPALRRRSGHVNPIRSNTVLAYTG